MRGGFNASTMPYTEGIKQTHDEACLEGGVVERGLEDLAAYVVEETISMC